MELSQLYLTYRNVLILHGITRDGAESKVPPERTFAERIINAIKDSNNSKLSTHSFAFNLNDDRHLWGRMGIVLREGHVIAADIEDTGLTKETLHLAALFPDPDYQTILLSPDRTVYNELVVQRATVVGIYLRAFDGQFAWDEIQTASLSLRLPVYFLHDQGLIRARWDTQTHSFVSISNNPVNLEELFA